MRRRSHALEVLFAALFLATVSQPAYAYLYNGHHLDSEYQPRRDDGVVNRLEWKIAKTDLTLPDIFTLKGTTSDLSFHPFPFAVKNSTGSFTTPIPSAVWLLGAGLLGLIGLQRRRGRKA